MDQDEKCLLHEKQLEDMCAEQNKQNGWFKASAVLVTIAVLVVGSLCGLILGKLGAIQTLLSDNRVIQAEFKGKLETHEKRIGDIEERNKVIDGYGYQARDRQNFNPEKLSK